VTDEEYAAQSPGELHDRLTGWDDAWQESWEDYRRRARILRDWQWSESLVSRPLPICVLSGI
jgi:hypothetical protein